MGLDEALESLEKSRVSGHGITWGVLRRMLKAYDTPGAELAKTIPQRAPQPEFKVDDWVVQVWHRHQAISVGLRRVVRIVAGKIYFTNGQRWSANKFRHATDAEKYRPGALVLWQKGRHSQTGLIAPSVAPLAANHVAITTHENKPHYYSRPIGECTLIESAKE